MRLICTPPGRVSCTGILRSLAFLATRWKISSPAAGRGCNVTVHGCNLAADADGDASGAGDHWQVQVQLDQQLARARRAGPSVLRDSGRAPHDGSTRVRAPCELSHPLASELGGASSSRSSTSSGGATRDMPAAPGSSGDRIYIFGAHEVLVVCCNACHFSSKTALSALKTQKFSRQQAHVTGPDE
jgi:hypothetical protein